MRRSSIRARRSTSAGPVPVRRRGPAPILIILAVIVAAVFCWVLGKGCGGSQDARQNDLLRTYASTMNQMIVRSGKIAQQFDSLRNSGISGASRDETIKKFQQMVNDAKDIAVESQKAKPPDKATDLQPIIQMIFEMRASGLEKFTTGLSDVLNKKDVTQAEATMKDGLMDMVVADEAYQRYKGGLETKIKAAKSGDLGGVEVSSLTPYVPKQDDALLGAVNTYVQQLSGTDTGNELHGVGIAGLSTSPARQDTTADGVAVLPYNATFNATVAVQNQGNQEEDNVQVVATLTSGSGTPKTQTKKIAMMKPNETQTLVFDQLKPSASQNVANVLKVVAGPVPNEKRTDNNMKEFSFIMLPEGG